MKVKLRMRLWKLIQMKMEVRCVFNLKVNMEDGIESILKPVNID